MPGPDVPLTARQLRLLWLRATGMSGPQAARAEGIAPATVAYHEAVIVTRLRARNITAAVHQATVQGLIGRYVDCGDRAAYLRHLRAGEPACRACLNANTRARATQRAERKDPA